MREIALDEFLRSFKVALNNAALYPKTHPYFLKSIADLQQKIFSLLEFLDTIRIDVTTTFLLLDGQPCENKIISEEVAGLLHQRKIKTIEIKKGVAEEGLVLFISSLALRPKEILRSGGIAKIIAREKTANLKVEELDYSQFLKDSPDRESAQEVFKLILQDKSLSQDQGLDKFKLLFKNFNPDDLGTAFLDLALGAGDIDVFNLKLFAQLTDKNGHLNLASFLAKELKNKGSLRDNPKVRKRIQELCSLEENTFVSEIYRNTLSSLLADLHFADKFLFDRDQLGKNYRLTLLSLFAAEKDNSNLKYILDKISAQLDKALQDKDWEYPKYLVALLKEKGIKEIDKRICALFEEVVWNKDNPLDPELFIDYLSTSSKSLDLYLERVFREKNFDQHLLKLFFKFFPADLDLFYKRLEQEQLDLKFLSGLIENLKEIRSPQVIEVYKRIFAISNTMIKIEVLKAMQGLYGYDVGFLLPVISRADGYLKKEALPILVKDGLYQKRALEMLFSLPANLFGLKNKIILENIKIIAELDLKEAKDYLIRLSKKRFFWNSNLKKKAKEVLEKWHD